MIVVEEMVDRVIMILLFVTVFCIIGYKAWKEPELCDKAPIIHYHFMLPPVQLQKDKEGFTF